LPGQGSDARPRALVTNDDGIDSEGLWHLAAAAVRAGFDVEVVAPAGDASGSGSAIRAVQQDGRVEVQTRELPGPAVGLTGYALRATPAFIVVAAIRGAFGPPPQYVLSGINRGANTGRGVLSSGTVAAALVALPHDVAAVAFSLDVKDDGSQPAAAADGSPMTAGQPEWLTAGLVARQIIPVLADLPAGVALSVNVPNLPPAQLGSICQTTLARFGAIQTTMAPAAEGYLRLNAPDPVRDSPPGSDSAALACGHVSVTALRGISEIASLTLPWPSLAELH
jgi:5'-nucleotidase